MHRFFCGQSNIAGDRIVLGEEATVHHLRDVLRLKLKEKIVVCDAQGNEYDCAIDSIGNEVVARIIKRRSAQKERLSLTIACAIPKNAKMDDIVDKLTQLGVARIIPMLTQRVIVKLDAQKKKMRQGRWQKIAVEASKQSQRAQIPQIDEPITFERMVRDSDNFDLKLIPTLGGQRRSLPGVLVGKKPKSILTLIGPEGDFTPQETALAKENGFVPVSLGKTVLRVDTAAIAIAAYIALYENS